MAEIKFNCPNCQRPMCGDEELLSNEISCPDCQYKFMPAAKEAPKAEMKSKHPIILEKDLKFRIAKIRSLANTLSGFSVFLLAIGLLFLLVAIATTFSGGDSNLMVVWALGSTCIMIGLWMFLAAQVIHIRANTEK